MTHYYYKTFLIDIEVSYKPVQLYVDVRKRNNIRRFIQYGTNAYFLFIYIVNLKVFCILVKEETS